MIPEDLKEKIALLEKEHRDLEQKLGNPELVSLEKSKELYRRFSQLEEVMASINDLRRVQNELGETKEMMEREEHPELKDLAAKELEALSLRIDKAETRLIHAIRGLKETLGATASPKKGVIIEIRAGVGGEEAALFAGELLRMYSHFAENMGWKTAVLDSAKTDMKGYKSVIIEISGGDIFSKLKYESGVHRVQRIPETEKSGRIHTSAATVAVLPKAEKTDFEINPQEIRIDVFRSSGPGGQNVNKRETAVRITHIPTGIIVASQETRTQNQNREAAMEILRAQLLAKKTEEENRARREERKSQIGTGDRSEKIRTYNYPQDRVTDHRIKKSWHNIAGILGGNMEPIIESLRALETENV